MLRPNPKAPLHCVLRAVSRVCTRYVINKLGQRGLARKRSRSSREQASAPSVTCPTKYHVQRFTAPNPLLLSIPSRELFITLSTGLRSSIPLFFITRPSSFRKGTFNEQTASADRNPASTGGRDGGNVRAHPSGDRRQHLGGNGSQAGQPEHEPYHP